MVYVALAGFVVCLALLLLGGAVIYQIILQNGRILIRIDAIEQWLVQTRLAAPAVDEYLATLPAGVPAPPINLPDLEGRQRVLAEWRGQRVLLVFFDPACAFSKRLLPALVGLMSDPVAGRPTPLIVSTGPAEANRALFDEAGFTGTVLLQTGTEAAAAYKVDGTPMSYLVGADGTIVGELAAGIQATLIAAGEIGSVTDATETVHRADTRQLSGESPGSKVMRDGLKPGTTAPIFRLPRLGGGEVSLLEYRGRNVVVIFSDPDCEPCEELFSRLASRSEPAEPSIVIISRGDEAANLAMASRHSLSLAIGLQRHWEVSREYGIFAAPAAFSIDEWGVVAREVAVGVDAIFELVSAEGSIGGAADG